MSRREFVVRNSDGEPVAGAKVYLWVTSGFWGNSTSTDRKETNKKGFVGFNLGLPRYVRPCGWRRV